MADRAAGNLARISTWLKAGAQSTEMSSQTDTFRRNFHYLRASGLKRGRRARSHRVRDRSAYGNLSKRPDPAAAAVASRWIAAKAGALALLWPALPGRGNRYLEEIVSAQSHSAPDGDPEP